MARAHFRARACRIFCLLDQILMIFEFSKRNEFRRAPHAQVRAHYNFFHEMALKATFLAQKISLQFFWFVHSSKSDIFRAIWNLIIFLKIQLFSKTISKFEKSIIFEKNFVSHENAYISNTSTVINLRDMHTTKVSRRFKIS